jgi:hypothetical protein
MPHFGRPGHRKQFFKKNGEKILIERNFTPRTIELFKEL